MANNGFEVAMDRSFGATVIEEITTTLNTQYQPGAACKIVEGVLALCAATDKPSHIYQGLITPASVLRPAVPNKSDATFPQKAETIPIQGRDLVLKSYMRASGFTPPIDGTACNSNASTAVVLVTYAAGGDANGDFDGGLVYCIELDQHREIESSTFGGGVHTLTLKAPFSQGGAAIALTTTHTVRVTYWAKGKTAVKLKLDSNSVPLGIDTSRGGISGGQMKIEEVDLKEKIVFSSAPYLA